MAKNQIVINGVDYSKWVDNLGGLEIKYGEGDSKTVVYTLTSSLTFSGLGYQYLYDQYFSDCNGYKTVLNVKVYQACVDIWYDFILTHEGVELIKSDCAIEINLESKSDDRKSFDYLDRTVWWTNGMIESYEHPLVPYCNQPGFLHYLAFWFRQLFFPIIISFDILERVWNNTVGFLIPSIRLDIPSLNNLDQYIGGCGAYTPTPLIKNILTYQAAQSGLVFSSTIFESFPYANTTLFTLLYDKGRKSNERGWEVKWLKENSENWTVTELLDVLVPVFNADYKIINDVLYFERKDYFRKLKDPLFDLKAQEKAGSIDDEYSVIFIKENAPAYGKFKFTEDALDAEGTAVMRKRYFDNVEWNENNEKWKNGEHLVNVGFGGVRAMFDIISSKENDSFTNFDREIDNWRNHSGGIFTKFNLSTKRFNDLIVSNDRCQVSKLLILEQNYNPTDAIVYRREIEGKDYSDYNFPFYFQENYETSELYQEFHYIDDPNIGGRLLLEIPQIILPLTRSLALSIHNNPSGWYFTTVWGSAVPESITVDFEDNTISFENNKIYCV